MFSQKARTLFLGHHNLVSEHGSDLYRIKKFIFKSCFCLSLPTHRISNKKVCKLIALSNDWIREEPKEKSRMLPQRVIKTHFLYFNTTMNFKNISKNRTCLLSSKHIHTSYFWFSREVGYFTNDSSDRSDYGSNRKQLSSYRDIGFSQYIVSFIYS